MHHHIRQPLIYGLIIALLVIPFHSVASAETGSRQQNQAEEKDISFEMMAADLLLVRPVGIIATAIGTVVFAAALPFTLLGGNTKNAAKKMIKEPATFTFKRPLGAF